MVSFFRLPKSTFFVLRWLMFLFLFFCFKTAFATNPDTTADSVRSSALKTIEAGCTNGSAWATLDINNVRTRVLIAGDMWWDLENARYEVPKSVDPNQPGPNALFNGAIWIGGLEDGWQLKLAAQTYRQDGHEFWPGPLDVNTGETDNTICAAYDRIWTTYRSDVQLFMEYVKCVQDPGCNHATRFPGYVIPEEILSWPGNRPDGGTEQLAPYYDNNMDGYYNPLDGDYPLYDFENALDCDNDDYLIGDQNLWWVINDAGNDHTASGGEKMGVEIHCQAFAMATNNAINDMTFYSYKIINRSNSRYEDVYFGVHFDADLGNYLDDFMGSDSIRGLGYVYNGDNFDEGPNGYRDAIPAVGLNFFKGPLADENDGKDNDRDGVVDETGERIKTSTFISTIGDFSVLGFPITPIHFYDRMRGKWMDGLHMVNNGLNGHAPTGGPGLVTNFLFSGDPVTGNGWTDPSSGNIPSDRRFLQSVGGFTLEPGAVNKLSAGVVWARASSGDPIESLAKLYLANDQAQSYFDNCFTRLRGPDAPDMNIQELDQEIILYLSNSPESNNYQQSYAEVSPYAQGFSDSTYIFEGYQIFQLRDASVTFEDLYDPDKSRLVAQVDIANGVESLVNYVNDPSLGALVPQLMTLQANDEGIAKSFRITEDLFATGNRRLINHKEYYYTVVAYAYNNYKPYDPTDGTALDGQKSPYLGSTRNRAIYQAIPHKVESEYFGTVQQSAYGDGPMIERLDGEGNGQMYLEFTDETLNALVDDHEMDNPTYRGGSGPVNVKVVDPLNVPEDRFTMVFSGTEDASNWYIVRESNGDTVYSETTISIQNEQIIPQWGMSVEVVQPANPGEDNSVDNGFIGAAIEYGDVTKRWLTGVNDLDGGSALNWIRSGTTNSESNPGYPDYEGLDDQEVYENVLDGTWAPYRLASTNTVTTNTPDGSGPAWSSFQALSQLRNLISVDVIFTNDKSKWTRVPVLEAGEVDSLAIGFAEKLNLRESPSVDKDGNPDGTGNGWGWFPGYAVDLERGVRLNMMFAEDSWLVGDNGADMLWNPTSRVFSDQFPINFEVVFGGKHFTYVMSSVYQGDNEADNPYFDLLNDPTPINKRQVFQECTWVTIPLLEEGRTLLGTDARVSLRVSREYENYTTSQAPNNGDPMYGFHTSDIASFTQSTPTAQEALSTVRVVPNPYYAYSAYESNDFDRRVKITNLPVECVIRIFTVNGTLVRTIRKNDPLTFVEWDLTNSDSRTIASGVYVIQVDAPGIGQAFVKWFGAMREQPLRTN